MARLATDFAARIRQGERPAIGDVYVTHSPFQQYTRDADALLRDVEVGLLAPVLVVQKGNPKEIKTIDDLARPGLQSPLTNLDFSTCGEMTFCAAGEEDQRRSA